MNEPNDPGVTAACNLLSAIGMAMMTSGQWLSLRTVLSMFDNMNASTIDDPAALEQLRQAVAAQRAVMEQMGK